MQARDPFDTSHRLKMFLTDLPFLCLFYFILTLYTIEIRNARAEATINEAVKERAFLICSWVFLVSLFVSGLTADSKSIWLALLATLLFLAIVLQLGVNGIESRLSREPLICKKIRHNQRFLWSKSAQELSRQQCNGRTVVYAFTLAALAVGLTLTLGLPSVPYRGDLSKVVDSIVLALVVSTFLFLVGRVLAEGLLVYAWISNAKTTFELNRGSEKPWTEEHLRELVEQSGAVTGEWSGQVILPFVVAALLIFSRSWIFDNWVTGPGLGAVFAVNIGVVWACWYRVKGQADGLKNLVIDELSDRVSNAQSADATGGRSSGDAAEDALSRVKHYHMGAYGSIWTNPIFEGLLIYFSGGSLQLALPDLLDKFGR
ncbi:hypothetical protein ACW73L_21665 [Methylolobus aquaticus]